MAGEIPVVRPGVNPAIGPGHGLVLPLVHPDADIVGAFGRGYTVEEVMSRKGPEVRGASACGGPLSGEHGTSLLFDGFGPSEVG